jgi:hypothetical protein
VRWQSSPHASRVAQPGFVVEQELSEFLKANRMAGVIVARPRLGEAEPKAQRIKESATRAQPTGVTRRIGASSKMTGLLLGRIASS